MPHVLSYRRTKLYSVLTLITLPPPAPHHHHPNTLTSLTHPKSIPLPTVVLPTRCGRLPHITPDAWTHMIDNLPVCISIPFDVVEPYVGMMVQHNWTVFDLFRLERDQVFVIGTGRDSTSRARGSTSFNFVPATSWGTVNMDIWVNVGDTIHEDAGTNRTRLALANTMTSNRKGQAYGVAWATIVGNDETTVTKCIEESIQPQAATGYMIDVATSQLAMFAMKSISMLHVSQQPAIIMVIAGNCGPADVIRWFAAGANLVETSYAEIMSRLGIALMMNVHANTVQELFYGQDDGVKLDARSFGEPEQGPLVQGCQCFACMHHSRGYIRHLVMAHEMLGETMLMTHNAFMMVWLSTWVRKNKIVQ